MKNILVAWFSPSLAVACYNLQMYSAIRCYFLVKQRKTVLRQENASLKIAILQGFHTTYEPALPQTSFNRGAGTYRDPDGLCCVKLSIPPRVQNGKRFRLNSKGLPGKNGWGNFYVDVEIRIPEKLDDKELEIFE